MRLRLGITLLETTLYIGLFAILLTSTVGLFRHLLESQQETRTRGEMEQAAGLLFTHLHTSIAEADNLNATASTFGADAGVLVYTDANGESVTIDRPDTSLTLSGVTYTVRRLRMQVGADPAEWLTPPLVDVERFRLGRVFDSALTTSGINLDVHFQMLNPESDVYQSAEFESASVIALQPSLVVL